MSLLLALQGNTTLSPTEGSITVAGVVAALVLTLAPSPGSVAITGNVPSITNTLAPTDGAIVVSGQTPSLLNIYLGSSGAIVIDGQTPSLSFEYSPSDGVVVVLGYSPTIALIAPPSADAFSGGYIDSGAQRRRTPEDLRRDRERFGISLKAQEVISTVATQQAARLEQDSHKRFEELERELQAQQIAWQAEYLTALNAERERLITAEIASRIQARMRDDEAIVLALIAAIL